MIYVTYFHTLRIFYRRSQVDRSRKANGKKFENILLLNCMLWRIDAFPGSDCETNDETTFTDRQQILISKNRRLLLWNGSVNMFPLQRIPMQQ
jgi:hypothetical protein